MRGSLKFMNHKINGRVRKLINTGKAFSLRYEIHFASKSIAKVLFDSGTPAGNKANSSFSIPTWILNGNKKIKKEYLKGIYTSEGSIYPTKIKKGSRWRIEIEQYKRLSIKNEGIKFMLQISNMLKEFEIITSPPRFGKKQTRKDGSKTIAIKMDVEKKYFEKFYHGIGFDDKFKTNRLVKAIAGKSGGSNQL